MLRMPWVRGLAIVATVLVCSSAASIDTIVRPPKFDYRMTTLANGLQVVMLEDHSTPVVHVAVWYHVGSKDEKPGRSGGARARRVRWHEVHSREGDACAHPASTRVPGRAGPGGGVPEDCLPGGRGVKYKCHNAKRRRHGADGVRRCCGCPDQDSNLEPAD